MTGQESASQDKRRYPRVALDVILFFRVDKPPEVRLKIGDQVRTGHAVDISEVGISFLVDAEIPKGTEIEIIFNLMIQKGKSERIASRGNVVYSFPRFPKKTYRVGVLFLDIDESDKKKITEYVKILFMHPKLDQDMKNSKEVE